ncbi:aspartate 1-decarboxylase [Bacteroidales bacterium KA00344]|nr:aspartate 1-decarboxylase [Bacteroidales bacterium KA00344]
MEITLLKSKIHRAVVTQADLNYVGSITIDSELMEAAGIVEYERVEIADVDNGKRLATYAIAGEAGSGIICLNGAAAHCVDVGDKVIIMAYANMTAEEAAAHHPQVVFVDEQNKITRRTNYEKHGLLKDQE